MLAVIVSPGASSIAPSVRVISQVDLRFQAGAMEALQEATEAYMIKFFESKRITLSDSFSDLLLISL